MALFHKKPQSESGNSLYTLGQNKTILIVGLGNPGPKYENTRHNIGFECIDHFALKTGLDHWIQKKDLKCMQASGNLGESRVIAIKPTTFMNLSGEAVAAAVRFYKIPTENIIVLHDELDIPFGQIRTRVGGGSAGHNGIKSIMQHIGEDFGRVRIGIQADTPMESADFVLSRFAPEEEKHLDDLKKETTAILTEYVYGGQLQVETRNFIV